MQSPPISQAEIDARISSHIDELLELWWAEQGASKPKDLELIALAMPFPRGQAIRALDLCCGPGDVGRAIRQIYLKAQIDCIDRDPFLTSICRAANQRDRIPGTLVVRDLNDDGWLDELPGNYDVVATVNALHWFDARRAGQLIKDVHGTLRDGEYSCSQSPPLLRHLSWLDSKSGRPSSLRAIGPRIGSGSGRGPTCFSAMTTQCSWALAMPIASERTACRSRAGGACSKEPASSSLMCC
jgi:SAM-dependent methyltransferase